MKTVTVVFNGGERRLAAGLQVRSLLSADEIEAVRRREMVVLDGRGNERGLGGALTDGAVLKLVPRPPA